MPKQIVYVAKVALFLGVIRVIIFLQGKQVERQMKDISLYVHIVDKYLYQLV